MQLTRLEVERIARRHFGDMGEPAVAIATAIAFAESGGDPAAVGDNYPRWQSEDSPFRYDRGLMQINSIHGYDPGSLHDPDFNMAAARRIYDLQGWNAWTSYRWGTYLEHYRATTPLASTGPAAPPAEELPPALGLDEWYRVLTDVFHPAYRGDVDSRVEAVGYRNVGPRRFRVYEVLISE